MAQVVQPVVQPNIASALLSGVQTGLGTYQAIKGIQRQDLIQKSVSDPVAFKTLKENYPQDAMAVQKMHNVDLDRFYKERGQTALAIKGLPKEQQLEILDTRIADISKDPTRSAANTQMLRDMIANDDRRAPEIINNVLEQSYQSGYLKRPPREKAETTALQRNLAAAGIKPGTPEYKQAILAGTKGGVSVTVGAADKGKFAEKLAESQIKRYDQIQERATGAEEQLYSLNELEAMDVKQGALEPMKVQLGAIGESLGVDMSSLVNVPAGQAYNAQAKKMVLGEMQKQKGPQTESDMRLIRQTVAGLGQTPQANKFLIQSAKAQALRKVEQRDFMENYLQENGNLDGASKAWNKYKRDVPMISKNLKSGGLPLFFYQFRQLAKGQDPNATTEDIIAEWNRLDKEAKKAAVPTKKAVESFKPVPLMMNQPMQQPGGQYGEPVRPNQLSGRYGF